MRLQLRALASLRGTAEGGCPHMNLFQEVGMCPACVASAGVVVSSVVSTGGLTALLVKVLRKKKGEKSDSKEKE